MNTFCLPKSEKTRQFILETAAPIFNKKGYAGTSLSDLTSATGLTKGSIYGNFKNKDEIAVAAFEYNVGNITRFFFRRMESAATFMEKLLVYPRGYRKLYKSMIACGGCPILNTATEADDTHEILCRLTVEVICNWKDDIVDLIKQGKTAGEIKSEADPEKTARILLSLFEGSGILAKVTGESAYILNAIDHMEQLIASIARKDLEAMTGKTVGIEISCLNN